MAAASKSKKIGRRAFKPGVEISIIGFGAIVVMGHEQPEANQIVAEAVERGVNYFDAAPTYGKGEAETKLGEALKPFRKQSFLACKTGKSNAVQAEQSLQESLKRLQTDHFDLFQLHGVGSMDEAKKFLAPGGAGEYFRKIKEQGLTKYLGFSAHSAEAAVFLMDNFPFDSVLFPLNYVMVVQGNFGPQILAKAKEKGITRLALKALCLRPWPEGVEKNYPKCWYQPIEEPKLQSLAMRYTLSEDVTAAIPPGDIRLWRPAMDLAAAFTPLTPAERAGLLETAKEHSALFAAGV
ncbi:MAG TPA: aldo/keto reductase [Planctomycetota bacterium]|nr:aldo/keto reductase [Planctomycetota bacterium]